MRALAEAWPDSEILQQVVAKLPWGHHTVLLDRVKEHAIREWYLNAAVSNMVRERHFSSSNSDFRPYPTL